MAKQTNKTKSMIHFLSRNFLIATFALLSVPHFCHGQNDNVPPADSAGFRKLVEPFLNTYCVRCHGGKRKEGKIDLHAISKTATGEKRAELWLRVMEQLRFREMPPQSAKQPDSSAVGKVLVRIENELDRTGHLDSYTKKLLLPEYGNYVNHEMLFSGEIKTPPFSPARLWRLSPEIYVAKKGRNAKSPFVYATANAEIRDYSVTSKVDESTIEMIMVTVEKMLEEQLFRVKGGKRIKLLKGGKKKITTILADSKHRYAPFPEKNPPTAEQVQRLVNEEFSSIHSRFPEPAVRKKYVDFFSRNSKVVGNLEAMKGTVLALHLSPEAIFRMELGLGPKDKYDRRRLSEPEIAMALAYALTDNSPYRNPMIVEALKNGQLKTKKGVQQLVTAMLNPPIIRKKGKFTFAFTYPTVRITRFFEQYFGYKKATGVFKDNLRVTQELGARQGDYRPESLVRDAEVFIREILRDDQDVLKQLLTSNKYYLAHPGNSVVRLLKKNEDLEALKPTVGPRRLAFYVHPYNLPGGNKRQWKWVSQQPLEFPENERAGILTHPAWLAAHSTNFDNDPVHRGIWVYKKLLAGVLQDLPPDVNAQIPDDPHKTLRQRLHVVRNEACWRCHRKINPYGEPFECYDDFGRYRSHFYFEKDKNLFVRRDGLFSKLVREGKLTTQPVDATGELSGTGDEKLDGPVKNAVDMIHRIAQSDRARQSFVRYSFRYFMGRNELLSDSVTLIDADRAYRESNGSFKALVVSLLSSDSFLYRR